MSEKYESVLPLNNSLDLEEIQDVFDGRLAAELLEERLELGCWIDCNVCMMQCNVVGP